MSMVAYAVYSEHVGLVFFLSRLAVHTQHLLENSHCSVVISQRDDGQCDPQSLARVTLQGKVAAIERTSLAFENAKACYCQRLPHSERLFEFADFSLFHFQPGRGRYIAGFGRTHRLSVQGLLACFHLNREV